MNTVMLKDIEDSALNRGKSNKQLKELVSLSSQSINKLDTEGLESGETNTIADILLKEQAELNENTNPAETSKLNEESNANLNEIKPINLDSDVLNENSNSMLMGKVSKTDPNELVSSKSTTPAANSSKTLAEQKFQALLTKYSSNTPVLSSQVSSSSLLNQSAQINKQPGIKLKIKDNKSILSEQQQKQVNTNENLNIIIKKNTSPDSISSNMFQVKQKSSADLISSTSTPTTSQGAIPKLKINTSGMNLSQAQQSAKAKIASSKTLFNINKANSLQIKSINFNDENNEDGDARNTTINNEFNFDIEERELLKTPNLVIKKNKNNNNASIASNYDFSFKDYDDNAVDGTDNLDTNDGKNDPLIWKPVFNTNTTNSNSPPVSKPGSPSSNFDNKSDQAQAPPPLAPFSIKKPGFLVDYSSNSNESSNTNQLELKSKEEPDKELKNESENKNDMESSIGEASSKQKKKKKNKDKEKEKSKNKEKDKEKDKDKKKHKNKDKKKDKEKHRSSLEQSNSEMASNNDSTLNTSSPASSSKKKDKKLKKLLKKEQKRLEREAANPQSPSTPREDVNNVILLDTYC
jgi:hypothetical protein